MVMTLCIEFLLLVLGVAVENKSCRSSLFSFFILKLLKLLSYATTRTNIYNKLVFFDVLFVRTLPILILLLQQNRTKPATIIFIFPPSIDILSIFCALALRHCFLRYSPNLTLVRFLYALYNFKQIFSSITN